MTVEHKLVVGLMRTLFFLMACIWVLAPVWVWVTNETVCGECSATITLPQVTLKVLAKGHEYQAERLES